MSSPLSIAGARERGGVYSYSLIYKKRIKNINNKHETCFRSIAGAGGRGGVYGHLRQPRLPRHVAVRAELCRG